MLSLLLSSSPEARRSFAGVGNCLGRQRCSRALGTFHTGRDLSARVSICHETRVVIRRARGKLMSAGAWCSSKQTWVRKCTEHRDPSKRLLKRLLFSGPWIRERIKGSGPAPFRAHGDMRVIRRYTHTEQASKEVHLGKSGHGPRRKANDFSLAM